MSTDDLKDRVAKVIEEEVRPALQMDGGDIELVAVADGVVTVRLQGACRGCPAARMTLARGVEARIKEKIPEIDHIEAAD